MKLQHVENLVAGKAVLLLYGVIGRDEDTDEGIDGRWFAQDIQYLQNYPEVTEIEVRINSQGGKVLDALNIFNAIRTSAKPCNTIIDGVAASSAGLVAMAGKKRFINDFARLMVHAPSLPDEVRETLDENDLKMLDSIGDLIADILSKNSKKSKEEIVASIEAETWFTAEEALEAGFVDEILDTDRQLEEILNELDLNESLSLVVNQLSNQLKGNTMSKDLSKVKNLLKLDENVSAEVVENAIEANLKSLKDAQDALEAEKTAHKTTKDSLTEAENKLGETTNAAAVEFVENAIKDGKFNPESKEALIEQAKNDFEGFKTLVESMKTPAAKITNQIKPEDTGAPVGEVVDGKLDGKTLRELERSNPELVTNLRSQKPESYKAMYVAQYGVEPAE